jgi:hypothetical protein
MVELTRTEAVAAEEGAGGRGKPSRRRTLTLSPSLSDDEGQEQEQEQNDDNRIGISELGDERASKDGGAGYKGVYTGAVVGLHPVPQVAMKDTEMGPLEMVRSQFAWHIAVCFFLTTTGGMYFAGTFKTYGLKYIPDDALLTNLATLSSLFNACGRIGWGALGDRFGHATTLVYMAAGFGLIQLTYPMSVSFGSTGFCTWTLLLFLFEGGNFCLYVPLIVSLFGVKHSAANYGLVFTVYSVLNVSNIALLSALRVTFAGAALCCGTLVFTGVLLLLYLCRNVGWPIRGVNGLLERLDALCAA